MWAALDAEFYLAFDAGREDCVSLVDGLGCNLLLLPTAYQEIADLCVQTQVQELRACALDALKFMAANGVLAAPAPDQNVGTDDGLAHFLIENGIVESDQRDAALILAEAACLQVACLLTLDPELIAVDEHALREAIKDKDLYPFEIKTA